MSRIRLNIGKIKLALNPQICYFQTCQSGKPENLKDNVFSLGVHHFGHVPSLHILYLLLGLLTPPPPPSLKMQEEILE